MFGKLSEAARLLAGNLPLIAAILLTVWLPGNLLLSYLAFFGPGPDSTVSVMRATMYIEGIFGPLYLGAMVYALWEIKQGRSVGYGEAIRVGIRNWGRLFAARFVASIQIMLGLIAFIIPGVVLAFTFRAAGRRGDHRRGGDERIAPTKHAVDRGYQAASAGHGGPVSVCVLACGGDDLQAR